MLILSWSGDQLEVGCIDIALVNIFVYVRVIFAFEFNAIHKHNRCGLGVGLAKCYSFLQLLAYFSFTSIYSRYMINLLLQTAIFMIFTSYILIRGNPFSNDLCMCTFPWIWSLLIMFCHHNFLPFLFTPTYPWESTIEHHFHAYMCEQVFCLCLYLFVYVWGCLGGHVSTLKCLCCWACNLQQNQLLQVKMYRCSSRTVAHLYTVQFMILQWARFHR